MAKKFSFGLGMAVFATLCLPATNLSAGALAIPPVPAPTIAPAVIVRADPSVAITFAGAPALKARSKAGRFALVGIRPHEVVDVQLQFPTGLANTSVTAHELDGGRVSAKTKDAVVASDSTWSFRFQAGDQPGLYRVLIRAATGDATLKFWVADPKNPKANPPVLTSNS